MKEIEYDLDYVRSANQSEEIVFIPLKKKEPSESQAIDFSKKVINHLENQIKQFNSENDKKVKLSQARKIYCTGARMRNSDPEYTMNEWALARLSLFFRIISGNIEELNLDISKKTPYNKLMDITDQLIPSSEDFQKARSDSQSHDLDYPYNNIEDLYIEEEDSYYIDY